MKKFFYLLALLFLFPSCSEEIPSFDQFFVNDSDYDCSVKFYNAVYEIKAHESKNIPIEIPIRDWYEPAELLSNGYPRAIMSKSALSAKSYKYTIENAKGIDCNIVNTSNYSILVSHNYMGENYTAGILCPASSTTKTKIFKDFFSGFSAVYKNESPSSDLEKNLQSSKCKVIATTLLSGNENNSYLVINVE